jgi:hypothetical protein
MKKCDDDWLIGWLVFIRPEGLIESVPVPLN